MTVYTGDIEEAGTDQKITVTVFGAKGTTSPTVLDKSGDRFERDRADLIKLELEDVAPVKKMRVETDGKGSRPDWYLDKVNNVTDWFTDTVLCRLLLAWQTLRD